MNSNPDNHGPEGHSSFKSLLSCGQIHEGNTGSLPIVLAFFALFRVAIVTEGSNYSEALQVVFFIPANGLAEAMSSSNSRGQQIRGAKTT